MIKIQNLLLPSTFMSRIQNTGLWGSIDDTIKDPLVIQAHIGSDRIKLRAYASKDGCDLSKITYPALSVNISIPLSNPYDTSDVFDSFHQLVSPMDLKEEQVTGSGGREKRSNQWIEFWGVDYLGRRFEDSGDNPFVVDYVTPEQIRKLLKNTEEYFLQNKTLGSDKVLRYIVEFCQQDYKKTVIRVGEKIQGDIIYLRNGEIYDDLSVSVQISHHNINQKEGRKFLNNFYDRHHLLHWEHISSCRFSLEGTVILMSKEVFFEQAK